jgi:7,8-dihydropterin-6-yl-methyl-4-(beta-D-ribofuranosyl)aminobenzene 5'-phosphate synthase
MKIVTLCEDTATYDRKGILAEHGVSFYLEIDNNALLFDTGQTFCTVHNAEKLGIDLGKVKKIILSHSHYDHTGGLNEVLPITGDTEIIAHPDIFLEKFHIENGKKSRIGVPYPRTKLEEWGARFTLSSKPVYILENLLTTGEIPKTNSFEKGDSTLYQQRGEKLERDTYSDDLSLIYKTPKGLLLILGCGHCGLINIIHHAIKITGDDRIFGILGGTHLISADDTQLEITLSFLEKINPRFIGVSHCTGRKAEIALYNKFSSKFFFNNCGNILEV